MNLIGEHLSKSYDQDLQNLVNLFLKMGGMAEANLTKAIESLVKSDVELAEDVIDGDKEINFTEQQLDDLVVKVLARRQPAATDLRLIMAVSKCGADIERIGDEAKKIAKMARRAGWKANNKRIRRLWREEGLRVPQRRRKKRLTGIGVAVGAMSPIRPNVIWAMDFQFDTTADGRTLKMLNVIDEFTREALAIEVDRAINADGVVDVLDRLALTHGAPRYVRFDNGPEFVAHAVADWC